MSDRDDRPSVYREDGVWVYRASAVGRCERSLRYARKETPPRRLFPTMQEALDRAASMEDPIIAEFERRYELQVTDRQKRVIVPVADGVEIRGSIDGYTYASGRFGLVEVKAFGKEYWNKWQEQGTKAFPEYIVQMNAYMHGLRVQGVECEGAWFVVGKRQEGTSNLENLEFDWVPYDHVTVARMKARVQKVEAWAADPDRLDTLMEAECPNDVVCNYWYLHDKQPVATWEEPPQLLIDLLEDREAQVRIKTKAEARIKELSAEIAPLVQDGIAEGQSSVNVEQWQITNVKASETIRWNKKKLEEELGERVVEFFTTSEKKGYLRIASVKGSDNPTDGGSTVD